MSQLADDLRAARKLIDTPEKFGAYNGSKSHALYDATGGWDAYFAADQALREHPMSGTGFRSVMDQFDRAIAAAEAEGGAK